MRYVIVGAGAIGGTVGAYMARGGEDVLFVDAAAEHVRAINEKGLTIRAFNETFTVRAPAVTPDQLEGPLHAVLLATKAQHTESAVRSLMDKLAPDGFVVSVQNGLNELTISRLIGAERTIGCFINFSADYIEPGLIHYGGPGTFQLGELDGRITPRVRALRDAISHWGEVGVTDNIFGYLWGKMGYGCMLFATALTMDTMWNCIDRKRELMVGVAREVLQVADAMGVKVFGFDGYEPDVYRSDDWTSIHRSLDRLVELRKRDQKTHSGIWRDLYVRRRRTEVDAQVGAVVLEAERLGLPVPKLRAIWRMIREIEDGQRAMMWSNLEELERV